MLTLDYLREIINAYLKDTDYQLISLQMDEEDNILVEIDRLGVVDVDFCAELNRHLCEQIEKQYPQHNYSFEVGSVSLTDNFKSKLQYQKHLGHSVEVMVEADKLPLDVQPFFREETQNLKLRGQLVNVEDNFFSIEMEVKVLLEGKKRKQKQMITVSFNYDDVQYTKYNLTF
ncbi:MAG: hypothetical protein J6J29_05795 [Paludibacteraceae bacterium]|nr:hypothetical protein [Paludibacteraceae bacterium]